MVVFCCCAAHAEQPTIHDRHAAEFRWADDSWLGQDKLFDHFAFAFTLATVSDKVFDAHNQPREWSILGSNMAAWTLKEILDGAGVKGSWFDPEGASIKDWLWSFAGCALALTLH